MLRIIQYIKRFTNIYFTSWPGSYQKKKISILENLLNISTELLESTSEDYWLDFGTLLGYYREKGIIPHDIDIDLAMPEKSYKKVKDLANDLPRGLKLYDTSKNHYGPKMYFSYKGFDADIFFYEDQGECIQSYGKADYETERQKIPKNLVFPIQTGELLGKEVKVPNKTKEYLEFIYGYLGKNGVRDTVTGFWHEKITS